MALPEGQAAFEHSELEADIERLSQEVKELHTGEDDGRDAVKQALHGHFYAPPAASGDTSAQQQASDTQSKVLPDYLGDAPADVKFHVEKLVDFAWHKGVMAAIKEARKSNDPLIIDGLHDALTDKVYLELQKRGHIK